ncbi:MAG TPA: hypothetical protein VFB67_01065, partial [Candidatus Polarisedimenticolaceae bacterium]|nr:hypothetical protein [Candidatus Polarisedimenticolaceae bacterium]
MTLSSDSGVHYAKLTPEELAALSDKLADESLSQALSQFESNEWPTMCFDKPFIDVYRGVSKFRIPNHAFSSLPAT